MSEPLTRTPIPPEAGEPGAPPLFRLGDLLSEWDTDAARRHTARTEGTPLGPVTGLRILDRELGGYLAPGLHVVHGQPGAGKTALGLQAAASCGFPALLLTGEMAPLELLRRITARMTGTFLGKFKTGELPPAESQSLVRRAIAACPGLVIADATRTPAPLSWLRAAALATRRESEHMLIVVDSVHSWAEALAEGVTEYEALNAALAGLNSLALSLSVPILAIAERNRASMKAGGQSASAGTRKFEFRGESVIDLTRDPEVRPDANGEVKVTVTLPKNRNGVPGACVELQFHGALQRFREVPRL